MKELRIIVAGGRDFDDYPFLMNKCIEIIATATKEDNTIEKIRIVSGGARGADKLGEQYAQIAHYKVSRFPADWDTYGKSAGYKRNAEMAKFASEDGNIGILIAFGDGKSRGTKHMVDLAKRINMLFTTHKPNKYGLPEGIFLTDNGKYGVSYQGKSLGAYKTLEEACSVHIKKKEEVIKQVADEYRQIIPKRIYDILQNYKVEVDKYMKRIA